MNNPNEELLEKDPREFTRDLANKHQVDESTILRRLDAIGKINKVRKMGTTQVNENQHK